MGEAAEYEIWRRHGVDISDDGWLERRHRNGQVLTDGLGKKYTVGSNSGKTFRNLLTQTKGPIEMNTNEMITIMQLESGAKIVKATYLDEINNGRQYSFKNVIGLELKEGDLVVAETKGSFSLLTVVCADASAVDLGCPLHALKHVVAKVNNKDYQGVKDAEASAHRKLALSEVTAKLDVYRKQVGEGTFDTVAGLLGMSDDQVIDEDDKA